MKLIWQPIQTTNGDGWESGIVGSVDLYFCSNWIFIILLNNSNYSRDSEAEANDKQGGPITTLNICLRFGGMTYSGNRRFLYELQILSM